MSCSRFRRVSVVAGAVLTASCWLQQAPAPPPPASSAVDYHRRALLVEARSQLTTPVRLIFDWSVREPGLRSGGRGVARLEPPYRARLDLFTGRGETVLRAALVGDELRLPEGASDELVPPPALFWSSLGIFRPGGDYRLAQGWEADDGTFHLSYDSSSRPDLLYELDGNGDVAALALLRGGETEDRLSLSLPLRDGFPTEATYRNLIEFRELTFTLDTVESVEPYPSDIWFPRNQE